MKKSKTKIGRIHVRIFRGCVDEITSRGLSEPVELWIHDQDVLMTEKVSGKKTTVYRLGPKKSKKAR